MNFGKGALHQLPINFSTAETVPAVQAPSRMDYGPGDPDLQTGIRGEDLNIFLGVAF